MQPTEKVRVWREGREWFWIIATAFMAIVSVVAAVVVVRNWPHEPTYAELNAELVEQFRAFENVSTAGGTCWVAFDPFADDPFLIETIAIDQNVPKEIWHTLYVGGNPERAFLTGMTLTEEDWRVLSSSDRLVDLEFTDCSFEGAFVSLDQMENLEWLWIVRSRNDGARLSQGLLDVLIDSLPSAPHLTSLFIHVGPLTDEQLQLLVQNAPQLESINLQGMTMTGIGFQQLAKLVNLRWLQVDTLSESLFPVLDSFSSLNRISIREVPSVEFCIKLFEEVDSLDALHPPCPFCSETVNDDEIINLNSNGIGIEKPPESCPHLYRLPSP
jgi:hypothetical protein